MSRFRCAYLHIGLHKTGSSAIQLMCDENRKILQTNGLYYPSGRWHGPLGSCFSDNKLAYVYNRHAGRIDATIIQNADKKYLSAFKDEIEGVKCENMLVSYEGFIDLSTSELIKLREFLGKFADHIRIIAYCRHPLSFATSEISQRAKMGVPTGRRDPNNPPIPKFKDYLTKFVTVFGKENIILSDFDSSRLYKSDIRLDILSKLGLPNLQPPLLKLSTEKTNESLSTEAILIAEAMAELLRPIVYENLFFVKYNNLLTSFKGSPLVLSDEEKNMIMEASKTHLHYLESEFLLKLKEPILSNGNKVYLDPAAIRFVANYFIQNDMVSQAYRWLLDRRPESEEVMLNHTIAARGDLRVMRQNIMRSPEFQKKVAEFLPTVENKSAQLTPHLLIRQNDLRKNFSIPLKDVTVTMILYNEEEFVSRSLVYLAENFSSFIVVDMGSCDSTLSIVKNILGERGHIVHYERKKLLLEGYGAVRNYCMNFVTTPWVLMIDADEMLVSGLNASGIVVDRPIENLDIVTVERRNMVATDQQSEIRFNGIGCRLISTEWPRRLYKNNGRVHWSGYIHEELTTKGKADAERFSKSALVLHHFSTFRNRERIKQRRAMYYWMLLKSYENPELRGMTNGYWYNKFVPENIEEIRAGAKEFESFEMLTVAARAGT